MSTVIIKQLLEKALNGMTPALSTAWQNLTFIPVNGTPYQKVDTMFAKPANPSFSGFHREQGIFQVTLNYPQGAGPGDCDARAELIRATFFEGASFTDGQITVTVNGTPQIAPGRNDGDRWAVPVKVPFFANVFE